MTDPRASHSVTEDAVGAGRRAVAEPSSRRSPRYKYAILITAVFVVFSALGLSQFSYPAILPAMQEGLDIANSQAGALATANLAGYLSMAILAGTLASRVGPRRVITAGLLIAATGMVITGLSGGLAMAAAGRILTGMGSACASVPAHILPSAWFSLKRRGLATGILPLGASMGLVVSGPLVPRLVNGYGEQGWRITWFVLAGITFCFAMLAVAVIRSRSRPTRKAKVEISTARDVPGSASTARDVPDDGMPGSGRGTGACSPSWRRVFLSPVIWHLCAVYFAFGFSYMTYMTFFTKRLIADIGYSATAAGRLFMVMGLVSLICGTLWGWISDRAGRRAALVSILGIQTVSYLLFALWGEPAGLTVSAVLFALTAWATPAIVATACGDLVGPVLASAAFGFLTTFQGLGQAVGPYVGGSLADALPSFAVTYLVVAGMACAGMIGATLLRLRGPAR
jgi:predicted MFS family arabinose efflux permease